MQDINLNGSWSVRPAALDCIGEAGFEQIRRAHDGWIEAQVPGEIHLDLIRAGQMPDPVVGANCCFGEMGGYAFPNHPWTVFENGVWPLEQEN